MTDKCHGCSIRDHEIDQLKDKVRNLTRLMDEQFGTPCEQIRHQQQVEDLHELIGDAYQYIAQHCLDNEDVEQMLDRLTSFIPGGKNDQC